MTASPGYTYINTIDGNRLEKTGSSVWTVRHSWDVLNRMTQSYVNGSNDVVSMTYRADGVRVTKANAIPGNNANKFTHYRYDGQMGIEDVEVTSGGTYNSVVRYALGARGVDAIARTTSGGTLVSYPLYDAHGNNIGIVAKSGSSWSISDERAYDAWGQVRSGGATGDQKGRYCANLGHKQDDESGLIYMRSRYYEATSGRFISEDLKMQGTNWFIYCNSNPVEYVDESGNNYTTSLMANLFAAVTAGIALIAGMVKCAKASRMGAAVAAAGLCMIVAWIGTSYTGQDIGDCWMSFLRLSALNALGVIALVSMNFVSPDFAPGVSIGQHLGSVVGAYVSTQALFLDIMGLENILETSARDYNRNQN